MKEAFLAGSDELERWCTM
jgi:RES domain-containing protein